jgi:hypothetical protein
MQLPFTRSPEQPVRARLRRATRTWWVWPIVAATTMAVVTGPAIWPWAARDANEGTGAIVRVASAPPGASIEVDGRGRGLAPADLALAPGEHRVTVRREGYTDATYRVRAEVGQTGGLTAELWFRRRRDRQTDQLRTTPAGTV